MNDTETDWYYNYTFWFLAKALGYTETEPGVIEASASDILEDAIHMIELGHRYLDLTEE